MNIMIEKLLKLIIVKTDSETIKKFDKKLYEEAN